jgi:hypothetical protein
MLGLARRMDLENEIAVVFALSIVLALRISNDLFSSCGEKLMTSIRRRYNVQSVVQNSASA